MVDDYEDNRQMYAELLGYAGYDVIEASDGAQAIAAAKRVLPDLIVMDLSLPVIDGWEATRRLKRDEHTMQIPILALTGHAPEGLVGHSEGALGAGCDAFLSKPCSPEKLLEMVQDILSRSPGSPGSPHAAFAPANAEHAPSGVQKARPRPRNARRASGG